MTLPGPAVLDVQVWQSEEDGKDTMVGHTKMDIEDRYFSPHWQRFKKKPIEMRNLKPPGQEGSHGKLTLWVDLIEKKF